MIIMDNSKTFSQCCRSQSSSYLDELFAVILQKKTRFVLQQSKVRVPHFETENALTNEVSPSTSHHHHLRNDSSIQSRHHYPRVSDLNVSAFLGVFFRMIIIPEASQELAQTQQNFIRSGQRSLQ